MGEIDASETHRSDAADVGGQEVDAVSVEVAAGAVVVLGGAGVGVAAGRHAGERRRRGRWRRAAGSAG